MSNQFITHSVYLKSADLYVLIIQFPEDAINDKLAPLSSERGLIYKSFYEDFVVGTCMADSSPFFYHVHRRPELMLKFYDIWQEVLGLIYKYSPGFKPENICVNQNNVLKTKGSLAKGEVSHPLTDNDFWAKPAPSTWSNIRTPKAPEPSPKDANPFNSDDDLEGSDFFDDTPSSGRGGNGDIHDNLPYELVGHLWESVGLYVNVRRYNDDHETLVNLIGSESFKSEDSYHLLVIQRCLDDWSDVITLLEQMGTTTKMNPPQILQELYQIILIYNPFLRLEEIDAPALRKEFKENQRRGSNRKRSTVRKMNTGSSKKVAKEQKQSFFDLSKKKLLNLGDAMKRHVVGQDQALEAVVDAIQRASVGLKREHEPLGVFMFTGNTGVGKGETAKALSKCLNAHLIRIDCQDYQQPHEVAKLAGSPPGYVGHDEGGQLTNSISKYPFSVVLFDEVEKAHSSFHERILQIIDDGVLTDNKGNTTSFNEAIIIMTSNIGVAEVSKIDRTVGFSNTPIKTQEKVADARTTALKNKFKPEFLNRIDEVVHFRLLEKEDYLHILDILLGEVGSQVKKSQGIKLQFTNPAKEFLLEQGIDKKFGARPMRRAVKKHVNTPLAHAILSEEILENSKVQVGVNKKSKKLTFKPVKVAKVEEEDEGMVEV